KIEGMMFSQDISTRDAPGGSQHRSSLVEGDLEQVRQRVSKELARQGFEPVRQSAVKLDGKTHVTLEFARKGEQVMTTLSPVDESVTAMVQMWVGSDRPDALPNNTAVRESREAYEKSQKPGQGATP